MVRVLLAKLQLAIKGSLIFREKEINQNAIYLVLAYDRVWMFQDMLPGDTSDKTLKRSCAFLDKWVKVIYHRESRACTIEVRSPA